MFLLGPVRDLVHDVFLRLPSLLLLLLEFFPRWLFGLVLRPLDFLPLLGDQLGLVLLPPFDALLVLASEVAILEG